MTPGPQGGVVNNQFHGIPGNAVGTEYPQAATVYIAGLTQKLRPGGTLIPGTGPSGSHLLP